MHAGMRTRTRVNIDFIEAQDIEKHGTDRARRRSTRSSCRAASASAASRARSRPSATRASSGIPYLGICLGMQLAVVEYARNVAGLDRRAQHGVQPRHARTRSSR